MNVHTSDLPQLDNPSDRYHLSCEKINFVIQPIYEHEIMNAYDFVGDFLNESGKNPRIKMALLIAEHALKDSLINGDFIEHAKNLVGRVGRKTVQETQTHDQDYKETSIRILLTINTKNECEVMDSYDFLEKNINESGKNQRVKMAFLIAEYALKNSLIKSDFIEHAKNLVGRAGRRKNSKNKK